MLRIHKFYPSINITSLENKRSRGPGDISLSFCHICSNKIHRFMYPTQNISTIKQNNLLKCLQKFLEFYSPKNKIKIKRL